MSWFLSVTNSGILQAAWTGTVYNGYGKLSACRNLVGKILPKNTRGSTKGIWEDFISNVVQKLIRNDAEDSRCWMLGPIASVELSDLATT